jgi:hypothetical protein
MVLVGMGQPCHTFSYQIREVLKKGQVMSIINQQACKKNLVKVNEARKVCQDCSK